MSDISVVLPCPFCGGKCDPIGWYANDSLSGPECKECGAAASSVQNWNRRISTVAPDEPSEANLVIRWLVEQLQARTIISLHVVQSRHTEPTARLINLFCNAVYSLENMPLSEAWAAEFAMEGRQLLEKNDYFRNLPISQSFQNRMTEPKAGVLGHSDLMPVQSTATTSTEPIQNKCTAHTSSDLLGKFSLLNQGSSLDEKMWNAAIRADIDLTTSLILERDLEKFKLCVTANEWEQSSQSEIKEGKFPHADLQQEWERWQAAQQTQYPSAWMTAGDQGTEPDITRNRTLAASWHFDKRQVIPLYTAAQKELHYETSILHHALLAIQQVANAGSPEMKIAKKALTAMKNQLKS